MSTLTPRALAGLIARVPPVRAPRVVWYGPSRAEAALLTTLVDGHLTVDAALDCLDPLVAAIDNSYHSYTPPDHRLHQGGNLCRRLSLPPAAAPGDVPGW